MKVDWAQPGEVMENLAAVLLRRENPLATQIRPSRGDGGIDVRVPLPTGGFEIYQVKKFNSNLDTSQLRQIKDSYESLHKYCDASGLDVRAWHLLMPLNPTKENIEWFDHLTNDAGHSCDWRGRDYLDGLAAKFPDVVDYYLHDGADRLERVVGEMLQLFQLQKKSDGAGVLTPAQAIEHLRGLQPLLDTDPHFRYGVSLEPVMPDLKAMGTGFVAAMSQGWGDDGAITVKIYPRFAEALEYRPIPGTLTFSVEPGSASEKAVHEFIKYGAPLVTPMGTAGVNIDLPGGLGGSFDGGMVKIGPSLAGHGTSGQRLRLVAVDPNGKTDVETQIDLQPTLVGADKSGFQINGVERSQVFDIEIRGDLSTKSLTFSIRLRDMTGRAPSDLTAGIQFLSALRPPNTLVLAPPFGPVSGERLDLSEAQDWLNFEALENAALLLATLVAIQAHTATQISVPSPEVINADAMNAWISARRLLEGEVVAVDGFTCVSCLARDAAVPTEAFAFAMESDFAVTIGTTVIELGRQVLHSPEVEVVPGSIVQHGDHQDGTFRSVDGAEVTIRVLGLGT